uniref:Uncharacterized protein n=1 Tax=mine drainage metagenome TaxID=410659 RepID=E6Q9S4_9ZZZZ
MRRPSVAGSAVAIIIRCLLLPTMPPPTCSAWLPGLHLVALRQVAPNGSCLRQVLGECLPVGMAQALPCGHHWPGMRGTQVAGLGAAYLGRIFVSDPFLDLALSQVPAYPAEIYHG